MWVQAETLNSDQLYRLNPEYKEQWALLDKYRWMLDSRPFRITHVYRKRVKVWDPNPKLIGDLLKHEELALRDIKDFSAYMYEEDLKYLEVAIPPYSNEEHNAFVFIFDKVPS